MKSTLASPSLSESKKRHEWPVNTPAVPLSLSEQIAKTVGDAIIAGEIQGGCRLHEVELSARFGVSRAPVREALLVLEREGLIKMHPRRGARVADVSRSELDHIFEPRIVLNGLLARHVAEHADEQFALRFAQAVQAIEPLVESADQRAYIDAAYRITRLLIAGCDNTYLGRLVSTLLHWALPYTWLGLSTVPRRKQSAQNWKRLAKAIARHDGEEAQKIGERLVRDSRDTARKVLSKMAIDESGD